MSKGSRCDSSFNLNLWDCSLLSLLDDKWKSNVSLIGNNSTNDNHTHDYLSELDALCTQVECVGYDSDGCQEQITSTQKQQLPRKYYKTRSFNKGNHSQSPTTTTTTISDIRTDAANDHNNPSHNNSPRTFGNVIINNGTSTNIITSEDKIATGRVSSAARLQVRMVQFGNTFHFVPVSAEDASTVAVNALTSAECQELSISVLPGVLHGNLDKIHATHATSADNANNYVNGTTATHISHTAAIHNAVINPKHIYKTSCDTYRVQVGKGNKKEKNGKFSRNARSEMDALWLCELALIFLDCPPYHQGR